MSTRDNDCPCLNCQEPGAASRIAKDVLHHLLDDMAEKPVLYPDPALIHIYMGLAHALHGAARVLECMYTQPWQPSHVLYVVDEEFENLD